MTKDKNNKKLIQDVQATGDEAARMLADLESHTESSHINYRPNTTSDTTSRSPQRQTDSPTFSGAQIALPVTILGLFVLIITFIAVADQTQQPSSNSSESTSSVGNDPVQKQKSIMTSYQRNFYNNTLANANQAILKSEHKAAIVDLQALKSDQYRNLMGVNSGLVNNKIINAKKQIKFLDQPGDSKYWESSNYGAQWFDKNPDNQFKMFFAYSKKCKSPVITFGFMKTSNGPIVARHTIRPTKNLSTLYIPMKLQGQQTLTLEKFSCN